MYCCGFIKHSKVKFETNEHVISEAFCNISLNTVTADISFVPSEDGKCKVVCYENRNAKHLVAIKDGTLAIEYVDVRKWYQYIGIHVTFPKITVYLPQCEYGDLAVSLTTGKVDISNDFNFARVDINETTGDISVQNISAGALNFTITTGKMDISNLTCEGDIFVKVSSGKTVMSDVACKNLTSNGTTGGITLENVVVNENLAIKRTTGKVVFDRCDATSISVKTTTGGVRGTLLTDKVFVTKSSAGRVEVPETTIGNRCKITTCTGSIKITTA